MSTSTLNIPLKTPLRLAVDVKVFLLAIPLISAFNYHLMYENVQLNGHLLLTYTLDTLQGYTAWWAVRGLILHFDRKRPYERGLAKRILVQLLTTTFLGLIIITLLTELTSWIVVGRPATPSFYTEDLFIITIWFLAINGFYIGLHFYQKFMLKMSDSRPSNKSFFATFGKQVVRIEHKDIMCFSVDHEYVTAHMRDGQKYYLNHSLSQVQEDISLQDFFRLNRQYIVHKSLISGFTKVENGKLLVQLNHNAGIPPEVAVSRIKAPTFKSWFQSQSA